MAALQTDQAPSRSHGITRVVLLGTGTPRPDPNRSGPATVVIANDMPYLVDFGPGVVRRATAAFEKGETSIGFGGINIRTAFLTHLHSDHTVGYPDLIFTSWIMGRNEPLSVYGPKGIRDMTDNVLKAWEVDIRVRTNGINHHSSAGCNVNAHEISPGVIYQDRNIRVTAIPAQHEDVVDSFSFRFETPDRVIVLSGDTTPTQALIDHSRGCDILIHEAYSMSGFQKVSPRWQEYRRRAHTSSAQLAEIASKIQPGLLVLYHLSNAGGVLADAEPDGTVVEEIRRVYRGNVVQGHDLDVFE
jgi:ribonuclease BN (tRNA processing enzyme)